MVIENHADTLKYGTHIENKKLIVTLNKRRNDGGQPDNNK